MSRRCPVGGGELRGGGALSANLTITDLFAGAGGSSTGAVSVPGVAVRLAANHWQRAVDVHNANHPSTDHLCADISQIDPRYVPTTDLLWASPECTNHSVAQGRKRAARDTVAVYATGPDDETSLLDALGLGRHDRALLLRQPRDAVAR